MHVKPVTDLPIGMLRMCTSSLMGHFRHFIDVRATSNFHSIATAKCSLSLSVMFGHQSGFVL